MIGRKKVQLDRADLLAAAEREALVGIMLFLQARKRSRAFRGIGNGQNTEVRRLRKRSQVLNNQYGTLLAQAEREGWSK